MRRFRFLLTPSFLLLIFLLKIHTTAAPPVTDRAVLPNINAVYCSNLTLRGIVFSALQNISNPYAISIDQIQAAILVALKPTFETSGGTWLVSATSYHRLTGYVDDRAAGMDTFCAVNDVNLNLYVVIMKIDK